MLRTILIGFTVCLIVALGLVVMRRGSVAKPQVGSRELASSRLSNEAAAKRAPKAEPLDSDVKAERGTHSDKLIVVARELSTRLHSLSINPQMRELVARRMAQEYAELFRTLHLPAEKEELLAQIIVDRFFSVIGPERDSYDQLAQDLLTADEYEKYAAYRDELPVKAMVKEVSAALQIDGAGTASEEIGRAIRTSSNRASRYWGEVERKFVAGELNEVDLSQEEQNALSQFDQLVSREVHSLSSAQLAALREWFRNSVRATIASIRQSKTGK